VLAPGGRLLIVDFAPHELEFLREQFAHERLGFSTQQVGQWLADCGLELVETRELVPDHDGTANLTVSVWLARRPQNAAMASDGAEQRKLERTT
jgi:TorA maturation chaperone TorD